MQQATHGNVLLIEAILTVPTLVSVGIIIWTHRNSAQEQPPQRRAGTIRRRRVTLARL